MSPDSAAHELLAGSLRGEPFPPGPLRRLLDAALHQEPARALEGTRALFRGLVEPLGDRFEPCLIEPYLALMAEAIARVAPELAPESLIERYRRVRRPRRFDGRPPAAVFVLSRVTLGADVAITSVLLDGLKRRFPESRIIFVGPRKNFELFAGDERIGHLEFSYGGTLRERLAIGPALRSAFREPESIVVDPDSRLTQLGVLPVCRAEEDYYFFESRAYGGEGDEPLAALARRWVAETFGIGGALPYIAPAGRPEPGAVPRVAVSFGVGENFDKRVADPFEEELLRALVRTGNSVLVDRGAGGEEAVRVERAMARCGASRTQVRSWDGPFAGFACLLAESGLYIGYDSAGQHTAAACGVPLVTVFAGFAGPRAFHRWGPVGPGPKGVIRVERQSVTELLAETMKLAEQLGL